MADARVVNASPVITLAKIGRLDLLAPAGQLLLIPSAVVREVCVAPTGDVARSAVESGFGATVVDVEVAGDILQWGLGAGESAVLTLARTQSAVAVVDDADARLAARTLGIAVIGTLGVVLDAKRSGRIESAAAVLRELRKAGLWIHDQVVREVLAEMSGEPWDG